MPASLPSFIPQRQELGMVPLPSNISDAIGNENRRQQSMHGISMIHGPPIVENYNFVYYK
jgi:hypothetical protein